MSGVVGSEAPAVHAVTKAEAETSLEPKAEPELAKQDDAISVTTVPDEAAKQKTGDASETSAGSGAGAAAAAAAAAAEALKLARGEVIMTPEQAKMQKLQKGYTLQPVLPGVPPPVIVEGKRQRKSSNHFGHSPDNEPGAPDKPKAVRPARPAGSSATPKTGRASGAAGHLAAEVPTSAPWITEKRKQLQDRVARIQRQLKKFGPPEQGKGGQLPPHLIPTPTPGSPGLWYHGSVDTPGPYGQAPAARSLSVDGGTGNGRKRRREGSESLPGVPLPGGKKPKMKKGQERLAPTGRLRNLYLHTEKMLEGLMKEKMAALYFNIPVDPEKLGIPHYRDIITHPMDLGTIKGKLEGGFYCGIDALEQDLYLVFDNAITFNPPGTDVHECAKALKDISEKRIKRLPKPAADSKRGGYGNLSDSPGLGTPTGGGTAADQRKMADMMRKMEQMQRDLEMVKSKGSSAKTPAGAGSKRKSVAPANKIMTFEDKRTLSLNINKLPHEKLGKVVEIIKKRRSNVVGNSEEIEIDIDLLDNTTLKELDKYVKDALNPKPKAPPSKVAALQSAAAEVVGAASAANGMMGGIKAASDSESSSDSDGE